MPLWLSACRQLRSRYAGQLSLFVVTAATARRVLAFNNVGLDEGPSVEALAVNPPINCSKNQNASQECNGIIHIPCCDRTRGGHDEDDGNEEGPDACPSIDQVAEFAHIEGAWLEFLGKDLEENGNAVRPVQCDCRDVEDAGDGSIGTETDKVDGDTEGDADPDGVERNLRVAVDLGPDAAQREEPIAGEGEEGAAQGLGCGEADELDDDEGADSVEDTTRSA